MIDVKSLHPSLLRDRYPDRPPTRPSLWGTHWAAPGWVTNGHVALLVGPEGILALGAQEWLLANGERHPDDGYLAATIASFERERATGAELRETPEERVPYEETARRCECDGSKEHQCVCSECGNHHETECEAGCVDGMVYDVDPGRLARREFVSERYGKTWADDRYAAIVDGMRLLVGGGNEHAIAAYNNAGELAAILMPLRGPFHSLKAIASEKP